MATHPKCFTEAMPEHTPFRFLDLPKELRFMVYENLDVSTKTLELLPLENGLQVRQQTKDSALHNSTTITVTLQTLPVQIFSTCRLISCESRPFLTRKLSQILTTTPRLSINAACLSTSALPSTQNLLCALLATLNFHPLLASKPPHPLSPLKAATSSIHYPKEIIHWLSQTAHLLATQRPPPCPLAGFMGTTTLPRVRLIIDVPKVWRYADPGAEALSTPPLYTGSVASQLSQLYGVLMEYSRGLRGVRGGAIVFAQEDERVVGREGVVVWKSVALEFGVCGGGW